MKELVSDGKEIVLKGISAVSGITSGKVVKLDRSSVFHQLGSDKAKSKSPEIEMKRVDEAVSHVDGELVRLSRFADRHSSDSTNDILLFQQEILHDPDLQKLIKELINEKKLAADHAVYEAFDFYIERLKTNGGSFFKSRIIDLRDIRNRVVRAIHQRDVSHQFTDDAIVVADEFSPAEIIMLARHKVRGVVSDYGGLTSHASIVAGSMGVPMVINTRIVSRVAKSGDIIIVDGDQGKIIVNPGQETVSHYEAALSEQEETRDRLKEIIEKPNVTQCGRAFTLRANVEFEEEILRVKEVNAEGIGLLRTESFFLSESEEEIDVEAQLRFYRKALEGSGGHPVTIRLLDVGGDKVLEPDAKEANPFLGWRGVRVLLDRRDLLRAQLEAILRASAEFPGQIRILVPMVSSLEELVEVRTEIDRMYNLLQYRNCNVGNEVEVGVMVEVPSVAIQADLFARHSDFLSIGTNDLTQFLLAVDRGNSRISNLFRQLHPAVWKMIANTVQAAHKYDRPVGICGEMAANPMIAALFIGLGIDELSMATPNLIHVKKLLRSMTFEDMKVWAERMNLAETAQEVDELIHNWVKFNERSGG